MRNINIKTSPWCPFCNQIVGRPAMLDERKMGEFPVGRCTCGAVYVSDPTGFNIGAAMVDCLVCACGENWDLAWDLLPGDDYLTARLEDYDEQTHQIIETRNLDGRVIRGVLYFIRLHKDIAELTGKIGPARPGIPGSKSAPLFQAPVIPLEPERDPKRARKRATKELVRTLAEAGDVDALVDLCFDDKRTVRFLQRLLFDPDDNKRWTVAHIMGKVFGRVSTRQPGMVSDLLHRLFESCADSASANWGAIEVVGEIIAVRPDIYGSFTRHLLPFAGAPQMQLQVVWALGTIARYRPDLIRAMSFYNLFGLLRSEDPALRGQALRLFGRIRAREVLKLIEKLTDDPAPVVIHEDGAARETEVGLLAREAIALIQGEEKS
ncbi:MAG: HEAT repeat domain-containing protein [Desulfobacterales bacterium]|nr:HEAT repeat domain-containing protein [Desulfobacterales bacterium]